MVPKLYELTNTTVFTQKQSFWDILGNVILNFKKQKNVFGCITYLEINIFVSFKLLVAMVVTSHFIEQYILNFIFYTLRFFMFTCLEQVANKK